VEPGDGLEKIFRSLNPCRLQSENFTSGRSGLDTAEKPHARRRSQQEKAPSGFTCQSEFFTGIWKEKRRNRKSDSAF
jgi:hypothetical protein